MDKEFQKNVLARDLRLNELRVQHDIECLHCSTSGTNLHTVWGEGCTDSVIFFVGEAPGENENELGRPFVGQAGKLLTAIFSEIGLFREHCYIANVIKKRHPSNRAPLPDEIAKCGPYLIEQILIVQPKVIVALGGTATKFLLDTQTGITRLRGVWTSWIHPQLINRSSIPLLPTFHPSYILQNRDKDEKEKIRSQLVSDIKMSVNRSRQIGSLSCL